MDKKTQRKNKTNLQVNWPTEDQFWTIKDLHKMNPQFGPEITIRVRLSNAIKKQKTVAVIGDKMNPHGRPEMVCAMCQADGTVKKSTVEAAKAAGIRCGEPVVPVVNINPTTNNTAVNLNPAQSPVAV